MFYEIVNNLCKERKTTITNMAIDIGLSNAAPTSWRKGAVPKSSTLEKIAKYFGVTTDYLLGNGQKETPTPKDGNERKDLDDLFELIKQADDQTLEIIRRVVGYK